MRAIVCRRRSRDAAWFLCRLVLLVLLVEPGNLPAQEGGWSADFGVDRSAVTIDEDDDVWGAERVQLLYRDPEKGGVFFGAERHTRYGEADAVFLAGGYRRLGDWTLFGQIGLTPNADFYYRQSFEGELSRRLVGTLVGHVGYRHLNFPAAWVSIVSPAATYYFAEGELHGRLYLVHNDALDVDSQSFLIRGQWQLDERVRLSGGVAAGERLFDITFLPQEPADGWLVYGETLVRIHDKGGLGIIAGFAHEEPYFDRLNIGIYYRVWF